MVSITSTQLQQILDVNAKSIEIYVEVNNQYETILKKIEEIQNNTADIEDNKEEADKLIDDLVELIKDIQEKNEKILQEHNKNIADKIKELSLQSKEDFANLNSSVNSKFKEIIDNNNKIDKAILRHDLLFGSSIITIVLGLIVKFIFG